jgi:hypothetical protein
MKKFKFKYKNIYRFLQFVTYKSIDLIENLFNSIYRLRKKLKKTNRKYQDFYEKIQLTSIYFCALTVLMYTVKLNLGYFPLLPSILIPWSQTVLSWKMLNILASPDKTFAMYFFLIEFLVNRPLFQFSILVKYNILLLLTVEMIENLIQGYWDLFCNREIILAYTSYSTSHYATTIFFYLYFTIFSSLYFYFYFIAMTGRFPTLPGDLQKLPDSIAFWLKIKRTKKK